MIREIDHLRDYRAGRNAEEARVLKWWILNFVKDNHFATADEIYKGSGCGDIAMYLALHELVTNKLLEGPSPYEEDMAGSSHMDWVYTLAKTSAAELFAETSAVASKKWDPTVWDLEN